MDKILAFSILSSTPAEISAAAGYTTRFLWRTSAGKQQQQQMTNTAEKAPKQAMEKQQSSRPAERTPRFAPEFDGINCFESIVSF